MAQLRPRQWFTRLVSSESLGFGVNRDLRRGLEASEFRDGSALDSAEISAVDLSSFFFEKNPNPISWLG